MDRVAVVLGARRALVVGGAAAHGAVVRGDGLGLGAVARASCECYTAISALRANGLRQEPGLDFGEPDPEALFEGFNPSEGLTGNARS